MSCCECDPGSLLIENDTGLRGLVHRELVAYYWKHLGEMCPYCESKLVAPNWFRPEGRGLTIEERWGSAIAVDPVGDNRRAIEMWSL